jgi:tetratricopeptide (TPR) repeat protein
MNGGPVPNRAALKILVPLIALAALIGTSCAAGRFAGEGLKHERAGNHFAAGSHYLAALNHDADHQGAKAGLNRVVENAYLEQRAKAQSLENERDYPGALNAWLSLQKFLAGARAHQTRMSFKTVRVKDRITEMRGEAAKQAFDQAGRFEADRRWAEAIQHYKLSEKYAAREFNNNRARMADAFVGWSNDLVKDGHFRDGAAKALEAKRLDSGNREHTKRAAAIYLALGKHFTREGQCRQALADLDQASEIMPSAVSTADRQAAVACADTPIAIFPFENDTRTRVRGVRLEDNLADRTAEKVRANASDYVKILDVVEIDRILRSEGIQRRRVASGAVTVIGGVRYLVLGRIEQLDVTRDQARPQPKTARYTKPRKCKEGEKGPCGDDGELSYSLIEREAVVRAVGTVKVFDTRTGEQVLSVPFNAEQKDQVRYADSVRKDGRAVNNKSELSGLRVTGQNPANLMNASRELQDEKEMIERVVARIADSVGPEVGRRVDLVETPRDPGQLRIPKLR